MSELLRVAIPFYLLLAAVASALGHWTGDSLPLVGRADAGSAVVELVSGCGAAAIVLGFSSFASSRYAWARRLESELRDLIGPLGRGDAFWLAAFSAVGEELFFRGALQPWVGWLPASVAFGVVHFGPRRGLLAWPVLALGVGLLFGALAQATGSVLPAIVAHFGVNWINLRRLAVAPGNGRC